MQDAAGHQDHAVRHARAGAPDGACVPVGHGDVPEQHAAAACAAPQQD